MYGKHLIYVFTMRMTLLKAIDDEYVPNNFHVNAPYEIP
jgi:hypothetical protein